MSGSAGFGDFVLAAVFNTVAPTPASGQRVPLQADSAGNLLVNVAVGGSSGINTWGGVSVSPALNISGDGTQVAPVTRPIQRKFTQILTTTPLAGNAAFTSAWFDTNQSGAALVEITWKADQAGAASPLPIIQGSDDTSNANFIVTLSTFSGSTGTATRQMYAIVPTRYWRFTYTNGATPQGSFEVSATEMDIPPGILLGITSGGVPASGATSLQPSFLTVSINGSAAVSPGANGTGATADNVRCDGNLANGGLRPLGAAQMVLQSAIGTQTWIEQRTPSTFKTAKATATGTTTVWTPTSGKKFRLMRFKIIVTANSAQTTGGVIDFDLQDGASSLGLIHSVFVPAAAGTTMAGWYDSDWVDLGNGILSAAANNALNLVFAATGFSGAVRVIACGTEE